MCCMIVSSLKRGRYLWIEIAECSGVKRLRRRFDRGLILNHQYVLPFLNFGSLGVFFVSDNIPLFWNPLNRPSSRQPCLPDWWVYLCRWQAGTLHHLSHGHGVCWEGFPNLLGCWTGGCSRWSATYFQESCRITLKNNTDLKQTSQKSWRNLSRRNQSGDLLLHYLKTS